MNKLKKNYIKPTIESVLDIDNGKEINSSTFFSQSTNSIFEFRYLLEQAIQEDKPKFVCYFCKQKIKIRGGGETKKVFHFAHLKDSDDCHIKTSNKYSKEEIERIKYNGAKESLLHLELKSFIYKCLLTNKYYDKGVAEVNLEKVIKSDRITKEWKKPDVSAIFENKKIVFELQLSTTFLSVIASRQSFYRNNNIFILWVFNSFETSEDKRKFTQSDVFYSNNRNGFVLNKEAMNHSILKNDLYLFCIYEKPIRQKNEIIFEWQEQLISLNDLKYDNINFRIYFFDVFKEVEKINKEIKFEEDEKKKKEIEQLSKIKTYYNLAKNKDYFDEEIVFYDNYNIQNEIQDEDEKSIYETETQRIFYMFKNNFVEKISEIYTKDYLLNSKDKEFIKQKYNEYGIGLNEIAKIPINTDEFNIIWLIVIAKMKNQEQVKKISKTSLHRIILDILSLKLDKIIGYDFNKTIQIAHRVIDSRVEYLDLYLKAAVHYKRMNYLTEQDTSQKLKIKLEKINKSKPIQNKENDEILKLIFPELFINP